MFHRFSLAELVPSIVFVMAGTAVAQTTRHEPDPLQGCREVARATKPEYRSESNALFPIATEASGPCDERVTEPMEGSLPASPLNTSTEQRLPLHERTPPLFPFEIQTKDGLSFPNFKANRANRKASSEPKSDIHWKETLLQTLSFTAVMNTFRFVTEPSTRKDLKGPFWKDYFNSVKNVRGWRDGDPFLVNYVGHPMEGAIGGNILIQNDRASAPLQFGRSKQYWKSRLKALGWAAAVSTQFELGPFGEATLGNVGLYPSENSKHPAAYVDLVITPLAGTGWLIGEDMLDRFLIKRIEGRTTNRLIRSLFRSWLNPSRAFANMLRGEWWWHRDDRPLKEGGRGPQK
jgi:hypothetical protein